MPLEVSSFLDSPALFLMKLFSFSFWTSLEAHNHRPIKCPWSTVKSDHLSLLLFPVFLLPIPSHQQGSDILNSEIRGEGSRSWLCYTQPLICQKGLLMITEPLRLFFAK